MFPYMVAYELERVSANANAGNACEHEVAYYTNMLANDEHMMELYDDPDLDFGYSNEPAYYGDPYEETHHVSWQDEQG
jgi:hypothetical protein